ncbi:MAG: ribosomal subunit interface protein [Lysobacteraceae bacterium]|nr:MAG: ribosomal subunit interface protein [Xanthomonadaceae bacterium]
MQISLTGQHIDITPALREYVSTKMDRIERHFDHVVDVHVVLDVNKLQHRAEATLHLPGRSVFAESTERDMYAAIDGLTDKLDRQIIKHKEKLTDHHRAEQRAVAVS